MNKHFFHKFSIVKKIWFIALLLFIGLISIYIIPSLARFKNRSSLLSTMVWNGDVAVSYHSGTGTESDPYVIANGGELAYLSSQLANDDYENVYFTLKKDIVLNSGIFTYDSVDGIKYILDNNTYYIKEFTNEYYDTSTYDNKIGTVNTLMPLDGFKGAFIGNSFTIYGMYITNSNALELALFTNFHGEISSLYLQNALVYGGTKTSGVASTNISGSINNVLFEGNVVGNSNIANTVETPLTTKSVSLNGNQVSENVSLLPSINYFGSEIVSMTISGNCGITGDANVKIDGNAINSGEFSVSISDFTKNSILLEFSSTGEALININNFKYTITYEYGVTAGITAVASNATFKNVINKANVFGVTISGGIIGAVNDTLSIEQSYNIGNISALDTSGGLIGIIENSPNNILISNCYNSSIFSSSIKGGLLGRVFNNIGSISIENTFDTSNEYGISIVNSSNITITNVYFTSNTPFVGSGVISGSAKKTTLDNLKDKEYVTSNLFYQEYLDVDDLTLYPSHVWYFGIGILPIISIDDDSNPSLNINTTFASWSNLSYDLNTLPLNSKVTFNVTTNSELVSYQSIYYYISPSSLPLNYVKIKELDDWELYTTPVEIDSNGSYIIYINAVDYKGNSTYINSDVLAINLVSLTMAETKWTSLKDNLSSIYVDEPQMINLDYDAQLIDIKEIKYYISDKEKTISELGDLDESVWLNNNQISLSNLGTYVIYAKIIDNNDSVNYINTDYIIYNGYLQSDLIIGNNDDSYTQLTNNITNKSMITLNFKYNNSKLDESNYTHNIVSNSLLPQGTKITLYDNINHKVYKYSVDSSEDIYNYDSSCDIVGCEKIATYPLTLFKETGRNTVTNFVENSYLTDNIISEDFTITCDFTNTSLTSDILNMKVFMQLHDSENNKLVSTVKNSIKPINVYSSINEDDTEANLFFNATSTNSFNDNVSTISINYNTGITYKKINDLSIIDTNYESKNLGLVLKLLDNEENIVLGSDLNNFTFKISDNYYYPNSNGLIFIDLNNGLLDTSGLLNVSFYANNNALEEGNYSLVINNYVSYPGVIPMNFPENEIVIPIIVESSYANQAIQFNVLNADDSSIIDTSRVPLSKQFNVLIDSNIDNPSIKVSFYEKTRLTAYDQEYTAVDLLDYVSNEFTAYSENKYIVVPDANNQIVLNFVDNVLNRNGYKLVFELYSGNIKIGSIEKYYVVK